MRPDWARVWHVAAFLIVLVVLAAASGVLRADPTSATIALIGFGVVYFVAAILMRRPYLGILGLLLSILGLFISGFLTHTDAHIYPMAVALVVSLFAWLAGRFDWKRFKIVPLFARWTLHLVSLGVFVYIIIERQAFTTDFPVVGVLSPLLLAGVYYFMDIRLGRPIFLWPFSLLLGTSVFVLLHSFPGLPRNYYGLIFAAMGCYLLARGAARSGLGRRQAILSTHTIGVLLALIGLFYAIPNFGAVAFLLATCSVGFWATNRIHRRARTEDKPGLVGMVEGAIPAALTVSLNVTSLALFVLLAWKGFLVGWPAFATALLVGLVYVAISVDRLWLPPKKLTKRPYIGFAAVFISISFLQLLKFGIGPGNDFYLLIGAAPAFVALTIAGVVFLKKRPSVVGPSLLDVGGLVMASALLVLVLNGTRPGIGAIIVGVGLLVVSAIAVAILKNFDHLASTGVGIVYIFLGVTSLNPNMDPLQGYVLLAVSIVLGILGAQGTRGASLLIGWHTASVFCLLASFRYTGEMAICLALTSVLYSWNSFRVQNVWYKLTLAVVSLLSGLAAIFYITAFGLGNYSIAVLLLMGAGFLIMCRLRKIRIAVPLGGLLVLAGYFLLMHQFSPLWTYPLWSFPLLAVFFVISVKKTEGAKLLSSLKWGILAFLFLVTVLLISRDVLPNSITVILSYLAFFAVFLAVRWTTKEHLYTLLSSGALALAIFFVIRLALPARPEIQSVVFAATSIAFIAAGLLFQNRRLVEDARRIYAVATLCALAVSIATISRGQGQIAYAVLAISTLAYLLLLSVWRLEIFPYLITVNLGLIAFAYARSNIDQFATQLLAIFLTIVAAVGLFILHPNLRQIMRYSKPGSFLMIKSWRGAILLTLPVIVLVVLVSLGLFAKFLDVPGFCVTCHYMKPYYDSWRVSTHADVPCVKCHYEPGLTPKLRGKVDGFLQLMKYATKTYSPKPKTGISDKACLRKGCHETELIKGPILYNETISFDHHEHLTKLKRGKELRCTSCHSQIVQGKHLTVTQTVCFLCHFKDRGIRSTAIGNCRSCHGEPEEAVRYAGLEFDHLKFLEAKQDVSCVECHVGVTSGQGGVAPERCLSCHSRTEEDLNDPEFLHKIHIKEKKIECFECHSDIRHGEKVMAEALTRNCSECHGTAQHVRETEIYAGTGGRRLPPSPDPMFRVGVHCSGCHKGTEMGGAGLEKAIKEACISCHDMAYGNMMVQWQKSTRQALNRTKSTLTRANDVARKYPNSTSYAAAQDLIKDAAFNISLVEKDGSMGVHNISYTLDLLDLSHDLAVDAISVLKTGKVVPRPTAGKKPDCTKRCHAEIRDVTVKVKGRFFAHGPHMDAELDCIACHGSEEHGKTRANARKCVVCHHTKETSVKCEYCHSTIKSRTVKHENKDFSHSKHIEFTEFECGECHSPSETAKMTTRKESCSQCHEE